MAALDLDRLPAGVVVLPEADDATGHLDPGAWVEAVRRPARRRLQQPVAQHLADVREHGEA